MSPRDLAEVRLDQAKQGCPILVCSFEQVLLHHPAAHYVLVGGFKSLRPQCVTVLGGHGVISR